jgi:hypothetical protein
MNFKWHTYDATHRPSAIANFLLAKHLQEPEGCVFNLQVVNARLLQACIHQFRARKALDKKKNVIIILSATTQISQSHFDVFIFIADSIAHECRGHVHLRRLVLDTGKDDAFFVLTR